MTPSVSVIIPTYNCAALLPRAIESVRAQQWPGLEIIVVDDGSSDQTSQVLGDLAASDLRSIRQSNAGPAAARNAGIAAARGEWVAFLDADDLWLPGKLVAQFDEFRWHPTAGFSFSGVVVCPSEGRARELRCRCPEQPLLLELLWGNLFATPTALVRRKCFDEAGVFDVALRTGEDWDMWLRLAARYEGVLVARPLTLVLRSGDPGKYPVEMLDQCTRRVLDRLFSCPQIAQRHPGLARLRRRVYAWHYSVLAKSYLRHRQLAQFGRLALRSIWSHPLGLHHLIGRTATC